MEIETTGSRLAFDLFAPATSLGPGTRTEVPGGAALAISEMRFQKALGAHETLVVLLHVGRDTALGVLSAWLYDKLKGRTRKLTINRIEVIVEQSEIRRVLAEHIEYDERP